MNTTCLDGPGGASRRDPAPIGAAHWLALAAAPTFAIMALLTGIWSAGPMEMLCADTSAWPLNGMVTMYLLMSAFHVAPWLKLIAGRRRDA